MYESFLHPCIIMKYLTYWKAYTDSKLSAETSFEEALAFLERTMDDVTNHTLISVAIKNVGGRSYPSGSVAKFPTSALTPFALESKMRPAWKG